MAEIINLRTARKQASRSAERQKGTQNAALHGRSQSDKAREQAEAAKSIRHLDGHRRAPDDEA